MSLLVTSVVHRLLVSEFLPGFWEAEEITKDVRTSEEVMLSEEVQVFGFMAVYLDNLPA